MFVSGVASVKKLFQLRTNILSIVCLCKIAKQIHVSLKNRLALVMVL